MKYTGFNRFLKSDAIQQVLDKLYDGTFTEFVDDWKWIFSFSKRYTGIIIFYTLLGLFSSTLSLGSAYISRMLINIITEKQTDKLWFLAIIMLSSTAFSLIFSSVMSRVSAKISIYVNNDIQSEIFDKIIDSKWSEINKYKNGDLLNRFNGDVSTVSGNAIGWIPNLIISIYTFIITFIVLVKVDWIMALLSFVSAPVLLLFSHYIMQKNKEYRKRVLEMNSQMMSFEVETFYNFDTIKSFGVTRHYSKELRSWQKKYKDYSLDYNMFQIKTGIWMNLLSTAVSTMAFGYCLYRLWTGQILYGDMTFLLGQRSSLNGKFGALIGTLPSMLNSSISAHRIRELVELPKEEHNEALLKEMKAKAPDGLSLEMENVSFSYKDGCTVYENAAFQAKPNEIVAVLGPSGGGKTTLFRLLLGLTNPQEGQVVLRDSQGSAVEMNADLRRLVSYVPQGNTMILGTIAENMRIVKEKATDEEIIQCLKLACAWDFVEPIGINAPLAERGRGISEGQAQRLSIARALLRDAPILLLDEATSALDETTESAVLTSLITHCKNKTVIVSTHRPSVLKHCQRIYMIADKTVRPANEDDYCQGTWDEKADAVRRRNREMAARSEKMQVFQALNTSIQSKEEAYVKQETI